MPSIGGPKTYDIKEVSNVDLQEGLDWSKEKMSIPAVVAGGISGDGRRCGGSCGQVLKNGRRLKGTVIVSRHKKDEVEVNFNLQYFVFDTIDFCPGNLGKGFATLMATMPLCFLEKCDRAYDVPFAVCFRPEIESLTLQIGTLSGTWIGTYSWDCDNGNTGTTEIRFEIIDNEGNLSGNAFYLDDSSPISGNRFSDAQWGPWGIISGSHASDGQIISIMVNESNNFVCNIFRAYFSRRLSAIKKTSWKGTNSVYMAY